ncbi:MAG: phospholipase D-like domain-containing protein [bacterium]
MIQRRIAAAVALALPLALLVAAPVATAAPVADAAPRGAVPAPSSCTLVPGGSCANADLRGRDLRGLNLRRIDLRGADLSGADLRRTILTNADLRDAELENADLRRARLRNADVRGADFGGAKMHQTRLVGATLNEDDQDIIVFPEELDKVEALLDNAEQTIDIVIYEIGGPTLVGQAGAPGALMRAVSRGVKVRVMVNGNWQQCNFDDTLQRFTNQYSCAAVYTPSNKKIFYYGTGKASPTLAVQESLMAAYRNPNTGVTPMMPEVRFANNNFNVTHQKTIVVDGSYATGANAGQPRAVADMLPTSQALVMTGNLLSEYWGSSYGLAADDTTWETDPAKSCAPSCQSENPARDFGVPVDDPGLISEIGRVYSSDFICGAAQAGEAPSRTNTNDLLTTTLPLTWSNGSFQDKIGYTPTDYPDTVYGYQFPTSYSGQPVVAQTEQGNVRQRMLDLINGAEKSLLLYNEEFSDPEIIAAVGAAAQRLGKGNVKLIMTWSAGYQGQKSWPSLWRTWNTLDDSGVSIMLSEYATPYTANEAELYVHGKVIVADDADAYAGSTNFTAPSIDWNRELGVRLTNREDAGGIAQGWLPSVEGIRDLVTRFTLDFTDTVNFTSWDAIESQLPKDNLARASWTDPRKNYLRTDRPLLCGPLPTSDTPVPVP